MDWKKEIDFRSLLSLRTPRPGAAALRLPSRAGGKGRSDGSSRRFVGLEIGSSQLAAAHVVNNGSRSLVQLVREPLAPGIMVAGEVRDPVALGQALQGFFARNDLPRRGVRLGVANSRIGVRVIEVAGIEDVAQLENAIGFRAHEMLSVPVGEAVLDYHILGEDVEEEGDGTVRKILLVVAYRDSIARYLAATDGAGLQVEGIDLEAFALLRSLSTAHYDAVGEAAVVAVCIGHERTTLAISDGTVCEFARVLDWGGAALTSAVARALKISPVEAEELKPLLSLEQDAPSPGGMAPGRALEAVEAVRHELQTPVRELLSSLRFYQAQPGTLAIGEVLLTGGTADMPGLPSELERELGVPVRLADPLARVHVAETVQVPDEVGSFAVAIGLGIEDR
jgi:type IV pilus assembly protein PilM